jgi:uncharacterized repeat protein (TIGR01451 family)
MQLLLSHILSAPAARRLLRGFIRAAAAWNRPLCGRMSEGRSPALFTCSLIILALLNASLMPLQAMAASVQGDHIVNNARFLSAYNTPVAASVTVTVVKRTPATIEFLKYVPGATPVNVARSAYRSGIDPAAPFTLLDPPLPLGSDTPINLSNPVPLASAALFHQGEPVFIRVRDLDQNLDRTVAETVFVTITTFIKADIKDTEVIRLTETGPDTGIFTGYIQSTGNNSGQYGGTLLVTSYSNISAVYTDIVDNTDIAKCTALVDPAGFVFNSTTGEYVDGVQVTLIDASTGEPATVFGDDGLSIFPSTITSGGTASDPSGRHYDFPPGGFRFPFVAPGNYLFRITLPPDLPDYSFPSTLSDAALRALKNGEFKIDKGSRLDRFTIDPGPWPLMRIDIPIDPVAGGLLSLQKSAGKDTVSIGDFIPYELSIDNGNNDVPALNVSVNDTLPLGFRYRKGSARIDGVAASDPAISPDGRTLLFAIDSIPSGGNRAIRYVAEVTAGAKLGTATNRAVALINGHVGSNPATATVQVKSDFLSSKSILMGQVIAGACGAPDRDALKGVEGVRIFLEDGTFVDTDRRGMFHFEGITPGSHVVQLDLDSLPSDYRVVPCEENTRFSGSSYSQFVDLQGGSMWRVDFHVAHQAKAKKASPDIPPAKGELSIELTSALSGGTIVYQAPLQGRNVTNSDLQLIVTLPEGVVYEANSSQLDGNPFADPAFNGTVLTYPLGKRPGDWNAKLSFRALLPRNGEPGKLLSSATITGENISATGKPLPVAENELRRIREEDHFRMPEFVLHPHFPTFSTELSDEDRTDLDDLALLLMTLNIEQIRVIGHTDNVHIAPRSRKLYWDNSALSLARAESVGRYLMEKLHLPLTKLVLSGMGDKEPLADNRSEEGKALNRRVEIKVRTEKVLNTVCHELLKEQSGVQKVEITGPAAKPQVMEEKDEPEAEKSTDKQNGIQDKEGILTPLNGFVMAQPIHAVRICLNGQLTPHLLLDGKEIPAERIGFTMKDPASGKVIYTYIGVDFGDKGKHTLELKGSDPFGIARVDQKIDVIRSGEIAAIRFKNSDGNIADARTPVRLQLEILDAAGEVIPAEVELEIRSGTLKPMKKDSDMQELARNEKTVADLNAGSVERVHVDEKGIALFQPVNSGGLYTVVIGTGRVAAEGETYVKPKMRDWILVGLGEGSVGYNAVSGHVENLTESGQDEHFYDDERIAFYAKGKVKGEWLLTMAYDSAKGKGDVGNRGLFQTIDPNTYYTLYGDATQQQYDAASNRKLYLKIERDQFYALFGDFDSGLTVTELSRYSRRMNGFKSEWQGKNFEANVFATETDQAYARDEIQGDGTSGLYQLTHGKIVPNSDKITIETRDRFRSEIIVESRSLSRFTDYSIDYDTGAIFFKEPIHSRDDSFNPIFIVAEYETAGRDTDALTYGGRIGAKLLDSRVKAGFTYIHEGQVSGSGDSYGVDARWNIVPGTTIKGEFAHTDTSFGNDSRDGNAWLAEIERHSQKLDAKLYYRQQDEGFGLGQQNESETGTRKFGLDAGYKLTDYLSIGGQYYRQYNLSAGNVQDVAEARATFTAGPYSAWLGGRHANDDMGSEGNRSSNQLIIGGSWLTLNKKLTLRAEHDQSISKNDNADFPTRTTFGADFKLTRNISLFAQQEITSGSSADTNTTTVGVKSTPWEGGTINTSMGRNLSENSDRMFALLGLKQTLKITDKWSVDGGLDRSQTIKESRYYQFNDNVPPASGDGQDFTAVSLGSTYTEKKWSLNSRLEIRSSDSEDKWGIVTAYVGEPREGWGWSARLQLFDTKAANGLNSVNGDLRLGMVYRPLYTRWIILDRLDVLYDRQHVGSDTSFNMDNWRVVNNLNANYKLDNKTQISLQYGAKYVLESIDGVDYSGYTDLIGVEGRYDLTKEWDLGLRGSALHSWKGGQISYSSGLSVGYNVMKNAWVSLGYNLVGFSDKDFSASEYTAQGPFVRFRFKFDQNSVKDAVAWINHI